MRTIHLSVPTKSTARIRLSLSLDENMKGSVEVPVHTETPAPLLCFEVQQHNFHAAG